MRSTPFPLVDAFTTERAFSGNPAGVVVLDDLSDDTWMQGVADEFAHAETAFLTPGDQGAFRLRWFTPVTEVTRCGQARLAAAHRLWETGVLLADARAVTAKRDDAGVVSRYFAPAYGIPQYPVTALPPAPSARTGATSSAWYFPPSRHRPPAAS